MNNFTPVLRFMVASDIHYKDVPTKESVMFERSLELMYEYSENHPSYNNFDALFIVGDFVNRGTELQFRLFKESLDNYVKEGTDVTIAMAGHEYMPSGGGEAEAHEKFARLFNMPVDVHKVIKGFHFISLSTMNGNRFDEEKNAFARNSLKEAAAQDPKKPIFFFQHPHLRDTVYGSVAWGGHDLTRSLLNYPQIIDFSGHSHAPINDPRSIHQKHFTSVGTGTLSYFELDEFDKVYGTKIENSERPEDKRDAAQMLIVEVSEAGHVRILPYDVSTEQFFPITWDIEKPWEPESFTYTDARYNNPAIPYFPESAQVVIDAKTLNSVSFTFDQAEIDDIYINSYDITLRKVSDKTIARKISMWSDYYFFHMPAKLSCNLDGLEPGVEYDLEIKANSFWKTTSKDALKSTFTL